MPKVRVAEVFYDLNKFPERVLNARLALMRNKDESLAPLLDQTWDYMFDSMTEEEKQNAMINVDEDGVEITE